MKSIFNNFTSRTVICAIALASFFFGCSKKDNPTTPTYTITFNTNGGSTIENTTVTSSGKITKPNDPTKANYTFGGWYSDAAFTKTFDWTSSITSNTTLYAKWTIITYSITFNTNEGSAIASSTINSGEKITKPTDPTKANYTLAGWYSDAALNTAFDFATAITSDITLYAKWASAVCDITELTITANNTDYEITFTGNASTITFYSVVAVPANANIKILTISDKATASANGSLAITNNAAVITVTAEDGKTKKDWTINFVSTLASKTGKAMIPDANFRAKLKKAVPDAFDATTDSMLTTHSSVKGLVGLDISVSSISDLAGIEFFTSLSLLYGFSNSLTSLDLSKNTALTKLSCSYNSLTSLDIRGMRSVSNLTITSGNGTNNGLTDLKVHTSIKDNEELKATKTKLGSAVKISTWDADAGSAVYTLVNADYTPQ